MVQTKLHFWLGTVATSVQSHNNFLKTHKCPWENVSVYVTVMDILLWQEQ